METYPNTDFNLPSIQNGRFELIEIKEGWLAERTVLPTLHRHDFHEVIWITHGTDVHMVDFQEYSVSEGLLLCIPKGSIHDFKPSADTRGWKLIFNESIFKSYQQQAFLEFQFFIPFLGDKLITPSQEEQKIVTHSIQLLQTLKGNKQQQVVLINFLSYLNDLFEESHSDSDDQFIQFVRLLNEEIYHHREVSYYADILGTSTKSLNLLVRKTTGESTLGFIHNRLVEEAKSRLLHTTQNINEIAYNLGFKDALYFSRFFKKRTGKSPEEYRKSASHKSIV